MARRETNTAPTISPKEQYSIDTGRRAVGEIRDMMKDPDTTKFKDVLASGKAQCVVGQVNGKNSYGAYEGYKSFVWKGGKVIMQAADPTDEVSASFSCLSDQQKFNDTAIIATP